MAMDATNRARTAAQWMRENRAPTPFSRADLITAVGNIDDWVDANSASFNTALPVALRGAGTTAAQKIDLLMYVLLRRQGRLRAEEDG